MDNMHLLDNQKKYNNQSFQKPKEESNQNKFQSGQNKNIPINKDSYLFLHSKKFLNKVPNSDLDNINNNFHSLIDYTEPQPQVYPELKLNTNNNKSTDYNYPNMLQENNNNNNIFSNQPKNKKLLEEYFKLKNENRNYNYNFHTYNNYLYKPNNNINTNNNNNQKNFPESQYKPLSKKQKKQKNFTNLKKPFTPIVNNNKIPNKKSTSLSRIYQPDKNINHSPSFTPIKNTIPTKEKNSKSKSKESFNHSPYFGSRSNSNSNIDGKNNNKILKPNKIHKWQNSQRITHSEETDNHIKSIIKNNNYILQKEKNNKISNNKKNKIHNPNTEIRKNLTPKRKEVQTCFDFKTNK